MTVYAFATHTLAFLAGSGLACWLVPWLIDRDARRDGYEDGYADAWDKAAVADEPLVDVCARLDDYLTPVDPPTASY